MKEKEKINIELSGEWEYAGGFGVDAGLCWIGDPCYILHKQANSEKEHDQLPSTLGKDWGEFCDRLWGSFSKKSFKNAVPGEPDNTYLQSEFESRGYRSFNYELGHEGLGVVTNTGYGDGFYPVYVKRGEEGRIMQVLIDFEGIIDMPEDDGDTNDE